MKQLVLLNKTLSLYILYIIDITSTHKNIWEQLGLKFITSWDDGHPCDLKLANLLNRYQIAGTFYIPINNSEGRKVMGKEDIRTLDTHFEIGSHTHDHIFLNSLSTHECKNQISLGKSILEDYLGHTIPGFCYPGGKYDENIIKIVKNLGISHARTVINFFLDPTIDIYQIPTTLQFYPHKKFVYCSNYIKHLQFSNRFPAFQNMTFGKNWLHSLKSMLNKYQHSDKVFHIWGHSWEIEENGLWDDLEEFFKYANSLNIQSLTVSDLIAQPS